MEIALVQLKVLTYQVGRYLQKKLQIIITHCFIDPGDECDMTVLESDVAEKMNPSLHGENGLDNDETSEYTPTALGK